jgi:hypothetical protein
VVVICSNSKLCLLHCLDNYTDKDAGSILDNIPGMGMLACQGVSSRAVKHSQNANAPLLGEEQCKKV